MAIFSPIRAPWGEYVGIGPLAVAAVAQLPTQDGWTFELHEEGRAAHHKRPAPPQAHKERNLLARDCVDEVRAIRRADARHVIPAGAGGQ